MGSTLVVVRVEEECGVMVVPGGSATNATPGRNAQTMITNVATVAKASAAVGTRRSVGIVR